MDASSDKTHKIANSSIVDLKAELFRKQQEFAQLKGSSGGSKNYIHGYKPQTKSKSLRHWKGKNKGVGDRAAGDEEKRIRSRDAEDDDRIELAKKQLEEKAKLYEKLKSEGENKEDEDGNSLYLVDFEQKFIDEARAMKEKMESGSQSTSTVPSSLLYEDDRLPDDEQWVDYTDEFGRSRRCMKKDLPKLANQLDPSASTSNQINKPDLMSNDMYRELMRQKWEEEQQEMLTKQDTVHYSNVQFDERREHGVGYFEFSKDEKTRQEQLDKLEKLRQETLATRSAKERLKEKRSALVQSRLDKVRARRIAQGKAVPEVADPKSEDVEPEVSLPVPVKPPSPPAPATKPCTTREWDLGKPGVGATGVLTEHKRPAGWTNPRDMRDEEFAPPTFLYGEPEKKKSKVQSLNPYPLSHSTNIFSSNSKPTTASITINHSTTTHNALPLTLTNNTIPAPPRGGDNSQIDPLLNIPLPASHIEPQRSGDAGCVPTEENTGRASGSIGSEETVDKMLKYLRSLTK